MTTTSTYDLRIGHIGAVIRATVKTPAGIAENLSAAAVMRMDFKKPSGEVISRTAIFDSDGTDGKVKYVTVDGDLDVGGTWEAEVYLELGAFKGATSQFTMTVGSTLRTG